MPGGRDVIFLAAGSGADDDKGTFGPLWKDYDPVMDLPREGWLFRLDPRRAGEVEGWFTPGADTSEWKPFEIAKFWGEQGYIDCHGAGWYPPRS